MPTKTRMNVYFEPSLLKQVEALALRRNVSKSAVIEAAVASFLSDDSAERLEAVFARRMDRLGRQIDCVDEDLAILGETVSMFIRFWLSITPPLPENAQASARAKGQERFDGFVQALGRRIAKGDRFIKELSRDMPARGAGEFSVEVDDRNDSTIAPPDALRSQKAG
ncbi:MAG: ribbon-helix-helix protein, CopG family [Rhodopseudomonas palustris]|nr:MAG: ribbon-helix-helix protein, CopG family [Rhodopseudomonas palustris]